MNFVRNYLQCVNHSGWLSWGEEFLFFFGLNFACDFVNIFHVILFIFTINRTQKVNFTCFNCSSVHCILIWLMSYSMPLSGKINGLCCTQSALLDFDLRAASFFPSILVKDLDTHTLSHTHTLTTNWEKKTLCSKYWLLIYEYVTGG